MTEFQRQRRTIGETDSQLDDDRLAESGLRLRLPIEGGHRDQRVTGADLQAVREASDKHATHVIGELSDPDALPILHWLGRSWKPTLPPVGSQAAVITERTTPTPELSWQQTAENLRDALALVTKERDEARLARDANAQELASALCSIRRFEKLFDDAGQGEYNVLALVDHYAAQAAAGQDAHRITGELRLLLSVDDTMSPSWVLGQVRQVLGLHEESDAETLDLSGPGIEETADLPSWSQRDVAMWADATFGPSPSNARIAARANEEMAELLRALTFDDNEPKAVEEAADVVIVLYRLVDRMGGDLMQAIDAKMAVNRDRKWIVSGGHGQHVRTREG